MRRLALAAVALGVLALIVFLYWQYIVGAAVGVAAWRHLIRRGTTNARRRPGTFATNVQALSVAYGAWNLRRLGPTPAKRQRESFTLNLPNMRRRPKAKDAGEVAFDCYLSDTP